MRKIAIVMVAMIVTTLCCLRASAQNNPELPQSFNTLDSADKERYLRLMNAAYQANKNYTDKKVGQVKKDVAKVKKKVDTLQAKVEALTLATEQNTFHDQVQDSTLNVNLDIINGNFQQHDNQLKQQKIQLGLLQKKVDRGRKVWTYLGVAVGSSLLGLVIHNNYQMIH